MEDSRLLVGRINGVYGVKGWVKVFSFTQPVGNILSYRPWWIKRQGQWVAMNVVEAHEPQGGKAIVAHLEGINSREDARELMGCDIALNRSQLPDEDDGFYWADLMGCQVKNAAGELLGTVSELIETGAHDVMRVKGEKEHLIPFVMAVYVLDVDLTQRIITVKWDVLADDV